jgi:rsbT antagonist protein RsbS
LIAAFGSDDSDMASLDFQKNVFDEAIKKNARGIVIDVSAALLMDSFMSSRLVDTCRVGGLLGQPVVVVGLKPTIVATLVELDVDLDSIRTASTIDRALDLLNLAKPTCEEWEIETEDEEQDLDADSDTEGLD